MSNLFAAEALEKQLAAIRQCEHLLQIDYEDDGLPAADPTDRALFQRRMRATQNLIRQAQPMYWSKQTTDIVRQIGATMKLDEIIASRELLYCDHGWCYFEEALMDLNWIMPEGYEYLPTPRLQVLMWAFVDREVAPGRYSRGIELTAFACLPRVVPTPLARVTIKDGDATSVFGYSWDGDGRAETKLDTPEQAEAMIRFAVAASMFLRMKLAVEERHRPDRAARRRMAKLYDPALTERLVSVILLRKRATAPRETAEPGDREYHVRWWVGGHIRQQWYPSLDKRLPILISPYIKGNENDPLKPRTTPIFLINR